MRKWAVATMTVMMGVLATAPAAAQSGLPLSLEVRAGWASPSGEWTDATPLEDALGYGFAAHIRALPFLDVYVGWDRFTFEVEGEPAGPDEELRRLTSGPHAGIAVKAPLPGPITPFGLAGLVLPITTRRVASQSGSRSFESNQSFGYELGGGVEIALTDLLAVAPAVRYRTHGAKFETFFGNDVDEEFDVTYLAWELGLRLRR